MTTDLPTTITTAGLQPQLPAALRDRIVARATELSPGLTANLPGILIEDVASTDTAAAELMDSARIDLINSTNPRTCNAWLLAQLGAMFGLPPQRAGNTSVAVVFTGLPGYVIPIGFLVSDGLYQYRVVDGGVIGSSRQSTPLQAVALLAGSWAVPAGSVTLIASSVPSGMSVTCSNPLAGTPGQLAQSETDHRAEVTAAFSATGVGLPAYVKTQLARVLNVQERLVSVQQVVGGGWKVLVGGGDPYEVAHAIWRGFLDISVLQGSTMSVSGITTAASAVVSTAMNHGLSSGQTAYVRGILTGMTQINDIPLTVEVIDEKTFSTGVDTRLFQPYAGGGFITPNYRNNVVNINNYPDVYTVPFITPPQQTVSASVTWNTIETNFINTAAVAQLAAPATAAYVNSVAVGQPLNLYELQSTFQAAVAPVLPAQLLTRLVFAVSINGVGTAPEAGTGIIAGDPESYFYTDPSGSGIVVSQG